MDDKQLLIISKERFNISRVVLEELIIQEYVTPETSISEVLDTIKLTMMEIEQLLN